MNSKNKREVIRMIEKLNNYVIYANHSQTQALFHNFVKIFLKYLKFDEIDVFSLKMIMDFIKIEENKPPYAAPLW